MPELLTNRRPFTTPASISRHPGLEENPLRFRHPGDAEIFRKVVERAQRKHSQQGTLFVRQP